MAISVAQARQICTKSELELVVQSTTQQIGKLDAKQLKAAIRRARRMRDKWRDLAASQTRDTKAENPEKLGKANARSDEKAQLFDEVLGRFEKRLTKVEPANGEPSKRSGNSTTKASRAGEHRQSRAAVRERLNEKTELLNAEAPPKRATKKSATAKATSKQATATKTPAKKASTKKATSAPATSKRAAVKKKGVKKATAKKSPPSDGLAAAAIAANREIDPEGQPTKSDKKRNLKATTAAKATAVKRSGAPRIQGHVSSQGRRNQAKRNVR